jgi:esterase/lipase superfamily enzyme
MPTPVIYQNAAIDPFAHLDPVHKSNTLDVFYATNRAAAAGSSQEYPNSYGNRLDSKLHLGTATVRMGATDLEWEELLQSLFDEESFSPIPVYLDSIREQAATDLGKSTTDALTPEQSEYFAAINRELEQAVDKEIMVYVHGTKVDFVNSALLTAEIDHFAGRDFVGVAFAWPSHQNILYYLTGIDVRRAVSSVGALKRLLKLLARHTSAEHINLLAYSAGGKVATQALYELRQEFAGTNRRASDNRLRLGSVVFAAIDVETDVFLERLPGISELADQVVVTVTDFDNALIAAKRFMGGKIRAGDKSAEEGEIFYILKHNLSNVEIIDVSYGQEVRGFDIRGHHYWYRHPWISSDIIFLLRTDLPPIRRGLSETEMESIWYLSRDYPARIRQAVRDELGGQWH